MDVGYMTSVKDTLSTRAVDNRMVAAMRLVLVWSALLIVWLNPLEPGGFLAATYTVLVLYVAYSTALYILHVRRSTVVQWTPVYAHWIDIAWCAVLLALSRETNDIFFFGFFFAILTASFRRGCATGLIASLISAAIVTVVDYATATAQGSASGQASATAQSSLH